MAKVITFSIHIDKINQQAPKYHTIRKGKRWKVVDTISDDDSEDDE